MAAQLFTNNGASTLASGITNVATSMTLATGTGSRFPALSGGDWFMLTLTQAGSETSWEVVKVTARSGDVLTIVRAQEGTTAAAWATSDKAELRVTAAALNGFVQATGGAASGLTLNSGYTEGVFAVTGTTPALSPTNGSIQTWALSASSTPTAGTWADGQSITLMLDDGAAYTVTWTSLAVTWKTGSGAAPTLLTSGYTVIELWKVGTTIYGALVGNA